MKRVLLAAALLMATPVHAQTPLAPEHTVQALAETLADMTRAYVATRAALIAAQARIAELEGQQKPPPAKP